MGSERLLGDGDMRLHQSGGGEWDGGNTGVGSGCPPLPQSDSPSNPKGPQLPRLAVRPNPTGDHGPLGARNGRPNGGHGAPWCRAQRAEWWPWGHLVQGPDG